MDLPVLFLVSLLIFCITRVNSLEDVTSSVLSSDSGTLAAFGDFDGDKHTDIFVIKNEGRSVLVHLAAEDGLFSSSVLLDNKTISGDYVVVGVVPADYDGDAQMDVLVVRQNLQKSASLLKVEVYWGLTTYLDTKKPLKLPDMVDHPLLLDENADMIPDLMGEKAPGDRYYWLFGPGRKLTEVPVPRPGNVSANASLPALRVPQSSAFVDLDNDLTADLCVVSTQGGVTQLEFWYNEAGTLGLKRRVPVQLEDKKPLAVEGQFSFVDIDGDLVTDILLPACRDAACTDSLILVYIGVKWVELPVDFTSWGQKWGFVPPSQPPGSGPAALPITLRVGDFNLDGYPDLLGVVSLAENSTMTVQRAVILKNVGCSGNCQGSSRTFTIDWGTWLEDHDRHAIVPAFYDLYDNGILDIMVTSLTAVKKEPKINIMKHVFVGDACFIKTTVTSGLCGLDNCPGGRKPYGVNQPGPAVRYKTTSVSGDLQTRTATQLSQSAYNVLQLPYIVFGLGQTPNFVDTLEVGIPYPPGKSSRGREWRSVIPNSQLVIIPYPVDDPSSWVNKLYVTPSRLMMLTGAALLGTCGFIAGIIGILHWKERIEDRKEKRQDAHRFHFDAM